MFLKSISSFLYNICMKKKYVCYWPLFIFFVFSIFLISCNKNKSDENHFSGEDNKYSENSDEKKLSDSEILKNEELNSKAEDILNEEILALEELKKRAADYVSHLTLEQKISQLFMENLEGSVSFKSYESVGEMTGKDDSTPLVAGGYIFFSYNIPPTREEMKNYIKTIRDYCKINNLIQPYLSVDQEGGSVNRLRKLNSKLPSNLYVSQNYSVGEAFELYTIQAKEMKDLGFDMNIAPVVETLSEDNKEFIEDRSFGEPYDVLLYANACVKAYEKNGIATVVKHFPGNTNTDPHSGLPEISLTAEELDISLAAFKRVIKNQPTAVLMSHARVSCFDPQTPSCLSKKWVTEVLREELGFEGLIISDDIFMAALEKNGYPPEKAVVMAIEAGVDCIMISEKRFASSANILYNKCLEDEEFSVLVDKACQRIILYKMKSGILE